MSVPRVSPHSEDEGASLSWKQFVPTRPASARCSGAHRRHADPVCQHAHKEEEIEHPELHMKKPMGLDDDPISRRTMSDCSTTSGVSSPGGKRRRSLTSSGKGASAQPRRASQEHLARIAWERSARHGARTNCWQYAEVGGSCLSSVLDLGRQPSTHTPRAQLSTRHQESVREATRQMLRTRKGSAEEREHAAAVEKAQRQLYGAHYATPLRASSRN